MRRFYVQSRSFPAHHACVLTSWPFALCRLMFFEQAREHAENDFRANNRDAQVQTFMHINHMGDFASACGGRAHVALVYHANVGAGCRR